MKNFRMLFISVILASFTCSSICFSLTKPQKKELYSFGKITIYDEYGIPRGYFESNYTKGSKFAKKLSKKAFRNSLAIIVEEYSKRDFWNEKIKGNFKYGLKFAKKSVVDDGFRGFVKDCKRAKKEIKNNSGNDALADTSLTLLTLGLKGTARTAWASFGLIGGTAYAVMTPLCCLATPTALAGSVAILGGVVAPPVYYAWNGATFVLVDKNEEPSEESAIIKFVHNPEYNSQLEAHLEDE